MSLPLLDQAVTLFRAGRLAESEALLTQQLQRHAADFTALNLSGIIAARTRRIDRAADFFSRAIQVRPTEGGVHRNLAQAQITLGRLEHAVATLDGALRLQPGSGENHLLRGFVLLDLNRCADALASIDRAIAFGAGNRADALEARAAALRKLDRPQEALVACQRALSLSPHTARAQLLQGALLSDLGRPAEALLSFDQALQAQPQNAAAHSGRGSVLMDLRRPDEALESFERALEFQPGFVTALNNRAVALNELGRFDEAVQAFDKVQQVDATSDYCRTNLAQLRLLLGDFGTGWPLYESRPRVGLAAHVFAAPAWRGEPIQGKTLLLVAEQGAGDTLQFCRYVPVLEALGAGVLLWAPARLRRLVQSVSATLRFVADDAQPPACHYHCRLLSVPYLLRSSAHPSSHDIPAAVPYLAVDDDRIAHWRRHLGGDGFRIGVCWQGARTRMDLGRSYALREIAPLLQVPGVRLISLQKGDGSEQLETLPPDLRVEQLPDAFDQGSDAFLDTAAVMQSLDLVVTSDTSIAHLAGALGRPTWIALQKVPEWRWQLEREDTPWYPTCRLFRQQGRGEWRDVFGRMREELVRLRFTTA